MRKIRPTNDELQILQVLWDHGPLSIRAIHARMHPSEKTGYTTVRKLLQILLQKKLVERKETGRAHIYRAKIKEQETQRQLLTDLIRLAYRSKPLSRKDVTENKKTLKKKKENT
jgi:BlaI family transcriptional regulator, penicillinase repressor